MEANWVLERTDIGQAEIATRTLKLPMTVRAVLLMVDGKSEVTQLQRKMSGLANGMSILESLLANGLIRRRHYSSDTSSRELADSAKLAQQTLKQAAQDATKLTPVATQSPRPITEVASAPAAPTQTAAPAPTVGKQRRSLALARMYMLDQMERMFGDRSVSARNLLRTATTREELINVFTDCREILLETTGEERTQRIEQEFLAMLPEATV
ncbi:MAG TPA: hypothetical protein VL550_07380 [Rhodocyclaceae bacterium]|nr:hypothetical protein [Rhodocyclaceae bacterium]